jgi:predicted cupin superfamily sugar epimerase
VTPGFDYADMEMGNRQKLSEQFPEHSQVIEGLTEG